MSERELELLQRIEDLERHTWRNSAILRSVAMVAFTSIIGFIIASGVVGGGQVAVDDGPAVQAVGPKVALAVLSAGRPRELVSALAAGDAARFQAVPGIGKRTAERIIVELREKVIAQDAEPAGRTPIVARRGEPAHPRALAREGLIELGYSPAEAEELLRDAEGESAEQLIAAALRLARSAG